jgi:aryl-alcohol dehydrogenase
MTVATVAVSGPDGDKFELREVEVGAPRADEVVVQIASSGICHTDIASHHGLFGTRKPVVLGHEGAGTVIEVGSAVTSVAVGDSVVLTMSGCGTCAICISGDPAHCSKIYELNMAGGRLDGSSAYEGGDVISHFGRQSSFATISVVPEPSVVVVPPGSDLHLIGPLGCGLMTGAGAVLNVLRITPGSRVAVFGAGAVGLAAVMAARICGASTIIAVDVFANRLELAEQVGATHVVTAGSDTTLEEVRDLSAGGVDYSVEASGHPAGLEQAVDSLGYRGVCAVVGTAAGAKGSFDWAPFQIKGATIRGVVLGDAIGKLFVSSMLDYHAKGMFPFERFVTTYAFADINQAVEDSEAGRTVKPVLVMDR